MHPHRFVRSLIGPVESVRARCRAGPCCRPAAGRRRRGVRPSVRHARIVFVARVRCVRRCVRRPSVRVRRRFVRLQLAADRRRARRSAAPPPVRRLRMPAGIHAVDAVDPDRGAADLVHFSQIAGRALALSKHSFIAPSDELLLFSLSCTESIANSDTSLYFFFPS